MVLFWRPGSDIHTLSIYHHSTETLRFHAFLIKNSYTIYCGLGDWCETCDYSNIFREPPMLYRLRYPFEIWTESDQQRGQDYMQNV